MYGVGPTGTGPASLPAHRTGAGNNPLLSNQRFNATADNNNNVSYILFDGVHVYMHLL